MKKLKNKIAFVLLFILVSAMSQAKGLDPRFQILPLPQNIEILKGDRKSTRLNSSHIL